MNKESVVFFFISSHEPLVVQVQSSSSRSPSIHETIIAQHVVFTFIRASSWCLLKITQLIQWVSLTEPLRFHVADVTESVESLRKPAAE